eukprot:m.238880 g.238880  ORF g.238880 m.238880 type:complete len:55 (+) comp54363_c2_seq6:200-364(+)
MTIQQPLSFPPFFPRAETGAYDSPALGFLNHLITRTISKKTSSMLRASLALVSM